MGPLADERAQGIVEAAMALPLTVTMLATVAQLGWVAYCDSCVSSALAHAQYSISADDLAGGRTADELLRMRMVEASPVLSSGTLTVTGAEVKAVESKERTIELGDGDFDEYRFATKNELSVRAEVTADVDYAPEIIFPVVPEIHFVRHVESSKLVDERFELG